MKKLLITSLVCLFLASCGFHLKGTESTGKELPKIVQLDLVMPDQRLYRVLEKNFFQQGIMLSKQAQYRIYLYDFENKKRSFLLTEKQKSSTKEVILIAGFKAKIFQKNELLGEQKIDSQMVIRYRSSAYLGSSLEEDNAHQQLNADNAEKLIRFFQAVLKP